jgi:uncharacterized membrane-anchored protein
MKKKIIIILFIAFAIVQLSVPLSMIVSREIVLKQGKIYKFKTKPIDPYDAFRGRYVTVSLQNIIIIPANSALAENQTVYALISIDTNGYSTISGIQTFPYGTDFVRAAINYIEKAQWNEKYPAGSQYLSLDLPFDRYYIDEEKAYKAEDIYRRHSRGTNADAYITVRILNGEAVLEELYVDGKPIMEILTNEPEETNQ